MLDPARETAKIFALLWKGRKTEAEIIQLMEISEADVKKAIRALYKMAVIRKCRDDKKYYINFRLAAEAPMAFLAAVEGHKKKHPAVKQWGGPSYDPVEVQKGKEVAELYGIEYL